MAHGTDSKLTVRKFGFGSLLFAALLLAAVPLVNSQDDRKIETIDSTATGTSTQLGTMVNVKVTIYQYSTDEDRAVLVAAFKQGQNQGLVDALGKMKPVGRIAITGTLGQDSHTFAWSNPTIVAEFASPRTAKFNSARPITTHKARPTI